MQKYYDIFYSVINPLSLNVPWAILYRLYRMGLGIMLREMNDES